MRARYTRAIRRRSARSGFAQLLNTRVQHSRAIRLWLVLIPLACLHASAQTTPVTTISGTVFDPRTTSGALPLPNVLVYITTAPVPPLPSGAQCLTNPAPPGVSSAYTAVDGTFTLNNVSQNTTYTLVIQAAKWRRLFTVDVGATPVTGLALHMPGDHTEGDIPMIAIVTGEVDGVECVLRDMGISDSEFTDDNGVVNPGGHIHLYAGAGYPGAVISPSTPSETTLTGNPALLNSYDMAMFPCQGAEYLQPADALGNLVNYANLGGRLYTTHFSYVYLDPDSPYDAQFPPAVMWDPDQPSPGSQPNTGVATLNTDFVDGETLAQWLKNAGADYQGTPDEIQIHAIFLNLDGVIPPTQPWLTLNNSAYIDPVVQLTFNTPVGAPAAAQCGRVMFNGYHVVDQNLYLPYTHDFPSECASLPATMSPQEEMLEYALFDLSTFVQPVIVPTLSIVFSPSPLVVQQGETGVPLSIDISNTSTSEPIPSTAILTVALPPFLTATAITDPTGGWQCSVSTLTCTRSTSLAAAASDAVSMTVNAVYPAGGLTSNTGLVTATVASVNFSSNVTASDEATFQQKPVITWATPASIPYGVALGAAQLDAASTVPGTFAYSPAAGTVLNAGQYTLQASFTPTNTADHLPATASVSLEVLPDTIGVTLNASANPVFVTSGVTFNAAVSSATAAPTGSVVFADGELQLASVTLAAGSAAYSTAGLATGVHSITAGYTGNTNFEAGTSVPLSERVEDFTLAVSGGGATGTATASAAQPAQFPLLITPVGGPTLPGAVALSVTGLPPGLTAVFSQATVAANSPATPVTLEVRLPGQRAAAISHKGTGKTVLPVFVGLLLLPLAGRLRRQGSRWRRWTVICMAAVSLAVGLSGCEASLTPRNSSFQVNATAGALSHAITLNLTVE
jgi:hypothetical protein